MNLLLVAFCLRGNICILGGLMLKECCESELAARTRTSCPQETSENKDSWIMST